MIPDLCLIRFGKNCFSYQFLINYIYVTIMSGGSLNFFTVLLIHTMNRMTF